MQVGRESRVIQGQGGNGLPPENQVNTGVWRSISDYIWPGQAEPNRGFQVI